MHIRGRKSLCYFNTWVIVMDIRTWRKKKRLLENRKPDGNPEEKEDLRTGFDSREYWTDWSSVVQHGFGGENFTINFRSLHSIEMSLLHSSFEGGRFSVLCLCVEREWNQLPPKKKLKQRAIKWLSKNLLLERCILKK